MKPKIKILSSQAGYNLAASIYDKKEKYLNSFEKNRLLPLLGDVRDKTILDVGAGTGRLAVELLKLGARITAVDVSDKMLAVLRKKTKNKIETKVADAESLPFVDNCFDIIVAAFLVVHLKDPIKFFDEAYRVLKDGGIFLVTNINQKEPPEVETPAGKIKIESYYHRPEQVKEILESLAFKVVEEVFTREGEGWVCQILLIKK